MTRRRFIHLCLSLALLAGVAGTLAAPARADVRIGITPAVFEVNAKPGDTGETEITVYNKGTDAFSILAAAEPYPGAPEEYSAAAFLSVEPATFDLAPGQEQKVTLRIAVPDEVESGGRYAYVTFLTRNPGDASGGSSISVESKVAATVLMTVHGKGKLSTKADVEQFVPVLEADGRIGFGVLLANKGNFHFKPSGNVEIKTAEGDSYGKLEFVDSGLALPGTEQFLYTQGTIPLEPGKQYESSMTLDYGQKKPIKKKVSFVATANVAIDDPTICENLDRGPTVTVPIQNDGDLAVVPVLQVTINDASGNRVSGVELPAGTISRPHDELKAASDLADRLVSGDYTLVAQFQYGTAAPMTKQVPFSIGGSGPNVAPLCQPASS
ncbi:MAG TPA: hypothetical protein VH482_14370 [Thermomicrobiales bacterium]